MGKAKMLGLQKPYTPNNRYDRRRGNPFTGKKTGIVILDERTPFGEKETQAAKRHAGVNAHFQMAEQVYGERRAVHVKCQGKT